MNVVFPPLLIEGDVGLTLDEGLTKGEFEKIFLRCKNPAIESDITLTVVYAPEGGGGWTETFTWTNGPSNTETWLGSNPIIPQERAANWSLVASSGESLFPGSPPFYVWNVAVSLAAFGNNAQISTYYPPGWPTDPEEYYITGWNSGATVERVDGLHFPPINFTLAINSTDPLALATNDPADATESALVVTFFGKPITVYEFPDILGDDYTATLTGTVSVTGDEYFTFDGKYDAFTGELV